MAVEKIVIVGKTKQGCKFRPSDWAERTCGILCTFKKNRIEYSPLLQPVMQNEFKAVIMDKKLASTNNDIYRNMLNFAQKNNLITYSLTCMDDE